ncbi:MAG: glucan 1,4-alpha-glucosidase, partial [Calditrichaeota bacterium]
IPSQFLRSAAAQNSENGLNAEYFNNMQLTGRPFMTRIDREVNFDWERGAPMPGVQTNHFSVRWSGWLVPPETATYELGVTGDDGYRLYINDKLVIDNWRDHAAETRRVSMALQAGKRYRLRLEYYENGGLASIRLGWLRPSDLREIHEQRQAEFRKAVELARHSEVTIFVGGISPRLEGEEMNVAVPGFRGGDRTNLQLPEPQKHLLREIVQTGKPVVLVLLSGSALAVNWAHQHIPAILQAWYPGEEGGTAIADVLFGDDNPAGRLPITFYRSVDQLPPFEDYAMQGRTYRYFSGKPLYPFGYGLSYSRFQYQNPRLSKTQLKPGESVEIEVEIQNTSQRDGEEVAQLYLHGEKLRSTRLRKSLKRFRRVAIKAGERTTVSFRLNYDDFAHFGAQHRWEVTPGTYSITVGGNSEQGVTLPIQVVSAE